VTKSTGVSSSPASLTDALAELVAVHLGHHDVEHEEMEALALGHPLGSAAGEALDLDFVPPRLQEVAEEHEIVGRVVDDEDACHGEAPKEGVGGAGRRAAQRTRESEGERARPR
jgi:hypothetical protein